MAKEEKDKKGIKLDFEVTLKDINGKTQYEVDPETRKEDKDKPLKMGSFIANLLWNFREKEEANVNNAILAMKINRSKEPIVLKDEERVTIKGVVRKTVSAPGTIYQIEQWLEGEDPFAE